MLNGAWARVKELISRVPWDGVADIALRVVIWLLLGSAINLLPIIAAYITRAGQQSPAGAYSITSALSSGDLLIAATVMLPPTLADLALNTKKAKRTRAIVIIVGALLALFSLLFYGFAFVNNLARENNRTTLATNLSPQMISNLSIYFFLGAVFLGAVCAAFLAGETGGSTSKRKPDENA